MIEENDPAEPHSKEQKKILRGKLAKLDEEFEQSCQRHTKAWAKLRRAFASLDKLDRKCTRLWKRICTIAHALGVERKAKRY